MKQHYSNSNTQLNLQSFPGRAEDQALPPDRALGSDTFFYSPGHRRTLIFALQFLPSAKYPRISFCPTRTWYVFLLSNFTEHRTEIQHVPVMLYPVRPGNSITDESNLENSELDQE